MYLVVLLGLATAVVAVPTEMLREAQAQSLAQASSSTSAQGQGVANDVVNSIPIYKPGYNTYGFNMFNNVYDKNFLNYYYNTMKGKMSPYQQMYYKNIFPFVYRNNHFARYKQQPEYEQYQYDYPNIADDSFEYRMYPHFNQEVQEFDRYFSNYKDFQSAVNFYKYVFPYLTKNYGQYNQDVKDIDSHFYNFAGPYSSENFHKQAYPNIYNKNYPYYNQEMNAFDHYSYDHMGPYSPEYYQKFIFPFVNKNYWYYSQEDKANNVKPYLPEFYYKYMTKNYPYYNPEVQDIDRHSYHTAPYASDYSYKHTYPYMNKNYHYNDAFDRDYYSYGPYSSEFYKFMHPYMNMHYPYYRHGTKYFDYNSYKPYSPEYFYKYLQNQMYTNTHYPKSDISYENFYNYMRDKRDISQNTNTQEPQR